MNEVGLQGCGYISTDIRPGDPGALLTGAVLVAAPWFALRTRGRQEKRVADLLRNWGEEVRVSLPLVPRTRYYGHRKRTSDVPLLPGYVFAQGPPEAAWAAIDSGRVVQRISIPDQKSFMHELAQIERALAAGAEFLDHEYLGVGRRVRVIAGPLRGVEGIVEYRRRPTRLVLQIHTLGQTTSLELDADLLESAD